MSTEPVKDFNYYLAHPDEMPQDADTIMKLAGQHADQMLAKAEPDIKAWAGGEPEAHPGVTGEAKAPELPKPEAKAPEPAPAPVEKVDAKPEPEPQKVEGVSTKDGKGVIPFAVLEDTRRRAAELGRLVADQAAQIEALKRKPEAKPEENINLVSDEDLEAIKAEMPALGTVIEKQQAIIRALSEKVSKVASGEPTEEELEVVLQEAIDRNPTLQTWQAGDPARYDRAYYWDQVLRNDPLWDKKSVDERFARVVELTLGDMPESKPSQPKAQPSAADLAKAAEAKLAAAAPQIPSSMTAIPGGSAVAQSELEQVQSLSSAQLGDYLMRQSGGDPEKLQQLINRL